MRRSNSRRALAGLLVLLTAGCVTTPPRRQPRSQPSAVVTTTPDPGPAAPGTPPPPTGPTTPPPVSLGPRAESPERATATAPPAPPIAPPTPAGQQGRRVVLNFDNADVEVVVQAASEILGFNYVLAPDVRGKVTVQTSGRIAQDEVFGVLLAILEVHGFTAVRTGNLYKIVRIPDAVARAIPTVVGASADPTRTGDELITHIVPVRYASVADVRTLLQPLISPQRGTIIANRENNVLIITDTASNIRRLLDIVRLVDVEISTEEIQIIPVHYADAAELAQLLTQIFAAGRLRGTPTGASPTPPPAPVAPPTPGAPPQPAAPRGVTTDGSADRPPLILAEKRSNALIVHARRAELEAIKKLVERIDINVTGGRRVFIYYAENAKSKDLAATMNAIYGRETVPTTTPTPQGRQPGEPPPPPTPAPSYGPGARLGTGPAVPPGAVGIAEVGFVEGQFRFIADETTNAVIVATTPRNWGEIEPTLKQLDRSPRQVLIEVLVAEVTLTDDTRLGVEWAIRSGRFAAVSAPGIGGQTPGSINPSPLPPIPPPSVFSSLAGLNVFAFAADKFLAAVNALAAENRANILSSPSIMTSENKKAVINVSDSIPIVTSQQVPLGGAIPNQNSAAVVGTQSVEYRDAGVILTVTPRIGERGTVALDVKQEVNDIGEPEPPTQSRRIIKREAETSVVLLNNQTLVLGGLIRDRRGRTERGIPILHKIPVVGPLFGFKEETIDKTELLILITPRVIGTALDAARITEALRGGNPQVEDALRKAPVLPPTSPGMTPAMPIPLPLSPPGAPLPPPGTPPPSP